MAYVPVARGERGQAGEYGGAEGSGVRREDAGGYGDVLDASAVDEETVFAILLVVCVDERCQQLDVAVFGGFHGWRVSWERSGTGRAVPVAFVRRGRGDFNDES